MKVFISWSGPKSNQVATALRDWLPDVIQALEPWMSTEDIQKGGKWFQDISDGLAKAEGLGIFCMTPGNVSSPWMAYEAGVLAAQGTPRVMTFLHGLTPQEVAYPLGLFQATAGSSSEDVFRLLKTLNLHCKRQMPEERLKKAFEQYWPMLQKTLEGIVVDAPSVATLPKTEEPAILTEILAVVRRLEKDRYATGFTDGMEAAGVQMATPMGALTQIDWNADKQNLIHDPGPKITGVENFLVRARHFTKQK